MIRKEVILIDLSVSVGSFMCCSVGAVPFLSVAR